MTGQKNPDGAEADFFRAVMAMNGVEKAKPTLPRVPPPKEKRRHFRTRPALAAARRVPEAQALAQTPPAAPAQPPARKNGAASNHLPALEKREFRRIKSGKRTLFATLDLHGKTQQQAYDALIAFVQKQHAQGARTLRVITGKGRNGEGVLRANLHTWLQANLECCKLVSGIAPAAPRHGGEGAFYITLRP